MGGLRGQQRRVLWQARLPWSERVKDPREARGTRHGHLGLLGLVVAAFAVGKKGLKQAAQLAGDVGTRTRKRLGLPSAVVGSTLWRLLEKQQPEGLRETLRAQALGVLEDPNTPRLPFALGVVSVDGKSLWTTHQGEVDGLEAVANDEEGRELWRLGALRAVFTSTLAAPCLDLEFLGAKEGESPAFRQLVHEINHAKASIDGPKADIVKDTRADYVKKMLNEEVRGTVDSIKAKNELVAKGKSISATYPLEKEYNAAYKKAVDDAKKANPKATDAELKKIGEKAGFERVLKGFKDGEVTTSTTGVKYPDYYGQAWDRAHPKPK